MSSISIETNNESQLTVQEYVRYIKLKENIQQFIDKAGVKEMLRDCEGYINGLTIDLIIRYSVDKKKP